MRRLAGKFTVQHGMPSENITKRYTAVNPFPQVIVALPVIRPAG
jgi:hypothetical protein